MEAQSAFELTEEAIELLCESKFVTKKLNRIYKRIGERANRGYYDYYWYGKDFTRKPVLDIIVLTLECYGFTVESCDMYLHIEWSDLQ